MRNLQQPEPPSNAAACLIVPLSSNRELRVTPETSKGSPGYRLTVVLHMNAGRQVFRGGFFLEHSEMVELARELQTLAGTGR